MNYAESLGKYNWLIIYRSSHPEAFLRKGVLKTCSKFIGEQPCRSVISIKLLCNFIEIALRHGCSPANVLHIFRTPFPRNSSRWLLLNLSCLYAQDLKCSSVATNENKCLFKSLLGFYWVFKFRVII